MSKPIIILAGDAGATKTDLRTYNVTESGVFQGLQSSYKSNEFGTLESLLNKFISGIPEVPDVCCIGVPGPVVKGVSRTTNIPWIVSESDISTSTGIPKVRIANDLEVIANSIRYLKDGDLLLVHPGGADNDNGNIAVIAPGTGLGQALIVRALGNDTVIHTEGGHADFAPQNETQYSLHRYLAEMYGHVSLERVLSGQGICDIFKFFKLHSDSDEDSNSSDEALSGIKAEDVSIAAIQRKSHAAILAIEMFASILGAHAGNIALSFNAKCGVILAGGIPGKNVEFIRSSNFVNAYLNKGRLSDYVAECPVKILINPTPGLTGALHLALSTFDIA